MGMLKEGKNERNQTTKSKERIRSEAQIIVKEEENPKEETK
jgi:hypothetical protein